MTMSQSLCYLISLHAGPGLLQVPLPELPPPAFLCATTLSPGPNEELSVRGRHQVGNCSYRP